MGNDKRIDNKASKKGVENFISPRFSQYCITDNKTNKHGCVINRSYSDAELAKAEVDANHK